MNWLKTRHSPGIGRIQAGDLDAANGIADIQEPARLPALSVYRQRMSRRGLDAEAVQHRSKDVVVIETVDQRFVQHHFVGHGAIHHSLIQIGGAQPPDLAGEHHVVAVVHLGEVIERARLFGIRQHVRPAVVLDADVAFFNIDIRRAVFAHGAELHQVAIGPEFLKRKQEVQRSHHIVHLSEHRMFAVDHRIRSGALLGKVNHRIRLEVFDHARQEIVVVDIADKHLDGLPSELLPDAQPVR